MLKEMRGSCEQGYPKEFALKYAEYRHEYLKKPIFERAKMDFGCFLRQKYVEFLKNNK